METTTVVLIALALLVGLVLGLAVGTARAAARRSQEEATAAEGLAGLRTRAAGAEARAERLAEEVEALHVRARQDQDVLRALAPVQSALAQVGEHVALLERERTEQFTVLTEQLHHARRTDAELQRTTAQLESALRSTSARGQWGEVELRRVLEASGMLRHVDFTEQRALGAAGPNGPARSGGGRPDVVVHLPGEKYLAVDAKVPMDAYLEASAVGGRTAEEAERRERLLAAHAKALRGHVDALARRRYHEHLPGSPELVVMFVPSEGLLAAALEADPTLLEHALRQGVAPTSPASLLALLRTTASIWSAEQVTAEAKELLALGRTLYERLGVVTGHLGSLGRSLRSSVQHYNRAVASVEQRLLVTARDFESLAAGKELRLEPVDADDAQVRTFTAPEVTAEDEITPVDELSTADELPMDELTLDQLAERSA